MRRWSSPAWCRASRATRTSGAVGRIGIKSLLYFEVVSALALGVGLIMVNLLQPGAGVTLTGDVSQTRLHRTGQAAHRGGDPPAHLPHQRDQGHGRRRRAADRRVLGHLRHRLLARGRGGAGRSSSGAPACATSCSGSRAWSCSWRRSAWPGRSWSRWASRGRR
ncbi:MAG: hypothetical protein WDO13_10600 [Verrucomicrobiota bacterium]